MDISTLPQALDAQQRSQQEPVGRAILDGSFFPYSDEVKPGDLIAANFDAKDVGTGGGLYLLQSSDGWQGCRRMQRVMNGVAIDQDGLGDWVTVPDMDATRCRVVGIVEAVYPPQAILMAHSPQLANTDRISAPHCSLTKR